MHALYLSKYLSLQVLFSIVDLCLVDNNVISSGSVLKLLSACDFYTTSFMMELATRVVLQVRVGPLKVITFLNY